MNTQYDHLAGVVEDDIPCPDCDLIDCICYPEEAELILEELQ